MQSIDSYWQQLYQNSQDTQLAHQQVEDIQANHDLGVSVQVHLDHADWLPSPAKGVKRLVLERQGGEKTLRATSIVAYAPDSVFAAHTHPKGEEFYVLAGTFSDQNGDYPAGTYVRNPPGSSHAPFSKDGCLIWVKLQQFEPTDNIHSVLKTFQADNISDEYEVQCLFDDYEKVELINAKQDTELSASYFESGLEILVLAGAIFKESSTISTGGWLRFAAKDHTSIVVAKDSLVLIKSKHLSRQ